MSGQFLECRSTCDRVLTLVRFYYDGAAERYPGIQFIDKYAWYTKILMAAVPYCIWQGLYFKVCESWNSEDMLTSQFISIDRAAKVKSGERQNSFY